MNAPFGVVAFPLRRAAQGRGNQGKSGPFADV
jgi:hypothetical protein